VSFFDEADEPRTTIREPRRDPGGGDGPPPRRPSEQQVVRRRQALALVLGLAFLIILVLVVKGCTSSAHKRSLRDYSHNVTALGQKSVRDVSRPFFHLLSSGGGSQKAVELQNQVNSLRLEADQQLKQAADLDVPGAMNETQRYVLDALELRRDGVARVAQLLQPALGGNNTTQAINRIAGEMRAFDASDVIWSQRVQALGDQRLRKDGVSDAAIGASAFLPAGWLDPQSVADKLAGAGGSTSTGPAAPGTHGHALLSVTAGGTTLQSGSAVNRIPASPAPTFQVQIQNQGQNDESNVHVQIELTGAGNPVRVTKTVQTKANQTQTVSLPLGKTPSAAGSVLTLKATVQPVPGEKVTTNNSQSYQALFTR
jgi:hypothetical protein